MIVTDGGGGGCDDDSDRQGIFNIQYIQYKTWSNMIILYIILQQI